MEPSREPRRRGGNWRWSLLPLPTPSRRRLLSTASSRRCSSSSGRGPSSACSSRPFVPRELRRAVHLLVTFGALVAAFVWDLRDPPASLDDLRQGQPPVTSRRWGAVAVDRPHPVHPGHDPGARRRLRACSSRTRRTTCPRSPGRRPRSPGRPKRRAGLPPAAWCTPRSTPLTLFLGRRHAALSPPRTTCLTMFVALETLSLPLYLPVRARPAPPASSRTRRP